MESTQTETPTTDDRATKLVSELKWKQRRRAYWSVHIAFATPKAASEATLWLHAKGFDVASTAPRQIIAKCRPSNAARMVEAALATGGDCRVSGDYKEEPLSSILMGKTAQPHYLSEIAKEMLSMAESIEKLRDELTELKKKIFVDYQHTQDGNVLLRLGSLNLTLRYDYEARYPREPDSVRDYDLELVSNVERYMALTENLLDIVNPRESLRRAVEADEEDAQAGDDDDRV